MNTPSMTRLEGDSFGTIDVPSNRRWGAQTQRSLLHFQISHERLPEEFLIALAAVKYAAARTNRDLALLDTHIANAIMQAAQEIMNGNFKDDFPLVIWQTGSGTHSNMNMNEVLANRASELLGGVSGLHRRVHANDHVNLGQSSNDVIPTAMHVAASYALEQHLFPTLINLRSGLHNKATTFAHIIKTGRTHLQDATPLSLGQEFSGYVAQLDVAKEALLALRTSLFELAIGGTAVGTGLNTHPEFGDRVANALAESYNLSFRRAANHFAAIAGHDAIVSVHGGLKTLSTALIKIANDLRWLASGPRCGLGEINLPANEPGSSMMPGKVNPSQCEALIMACYQVMGNDVVISQCGAMGNFELNACKPLIAHALFQSIRLLCDGMRSFNRYCVSGLSANEPHIAEMNNKSLMLVTALVPHIGYDRAAEIAHYAHEHRLLLREAAVKFDISEEQYRDWVSPSKMIENHRTHLV